MLTKYYGKGKLMNGGRPVLLPVLLAITAVAAPSGQASAEASTAAHGRRASALTSMVAIPRRPATRVVARAAFNHRLGQTVLTTTAGLTLYSLGAESKGRFICADKGCLSEWHPLAAPMGAKPAGPVALGTIRRPDGSLQVTHGGHPLYTFAGDRAPGQAKGEGIKDVGTWHAVAVPGHGR